MKAFKDEHVKNAYEAIRAIRNRQRKKLLHIICYQPGHTVKELYKKLGTGQSQCSQNLAVLRRAKIVVPVQKGKEVYYAINEPYVAALQKLLKELSEL